MKQKKQRVIIDVYYDENQNQYYKVKTVTGNPPNNCDSGVFLNEYDIDDYDDDWDVVTDYRVVSWAD